MENHEGTERYRNEGFGDSNGKRIDGAVRTMTPGESGMLRVMLDCLDDAVLFLDRDDVVVYANEAARMELRLGAGMRFPGVSVEDVSGGVLIEKDSVTERRASCRVSRIVSDDGADVGQVLSFPASRDLSRTVVDIPMRSDLADEILAHSQDVSYRRNLVDDRYDYFSPSIERITGYTHDEMMAMSIEEVLANVHPDDHDNILRTLRDAESGNRDTFQLEYRFRHKSNGTYRWLHDLFSVVRDERGGQRYRIGSVRDVSDRKLFELALYRSESRWSALISNAPGLILVCGEDMKIQYANRDMFGFVIEDLIGGKLDELVEPKRRGMMRDAVDAVFSDGVVQRLTAPLRAAWDEPRWFDISLAPIVPHDPGWAVSVFIEDITRRKRDEETIRFHSYLLDHVSDAVYYGDTDLKIRYWSSGAERLYGWTAEEAVGKATYDLLRTEFPEPIDAIWAIIRTTGEWRGEMVHYRKDGRRIDALCTARMVDDPADGTPRLMAIVRDITELKAASRRIEALNRGLESQVRARTEQLESAIERLNEIIAQKEEAERRLAESEERYRMVADFTYDWEYWIDPTGKLVYCSPSCENITGFPRDDFTGDPSLLDAIIFPEDRSSIESQLAVAETGSECSIDYRIVTRAGDVRWLAKRSRPVYGATGAWLGLRVSCRDITDRLRVQEELRNREADLAEAQRVAKVGSWRFDVATGAVTWSDELYRVFEVDRKDFSGFYESFIDRVHPDDIDAVTSANRRAREDGAQFEVEYRINTRGGMKYVHEIGYAVEDEGGSITGLFGTAQDVTERALAARALEESHERSRRGEAIARALINTTGGPVVVVDARGRIVDCNQMFQDGCGIDGVNPGMILDEVIEDNRYRAWRPVMNRVVATGKESHIEEADGDRRYVTVFYPVPDLGPGSARLVIVIRDVSELIEAQRRIIQISELERQSIGQNIHDGLGQEITGIEYLARALLETMRSRGYLETLDMQRICDLLGKAQDHARMLSRTIVPLRLQHQDLASALRELAETTEAIFGVHCLCAVTTSVGDIDTTESSHLYFIALEAVNNALKHDSPRLIELVFSSFDGVRTLVVRNDGRKTGVNFGGAKGIGFDIMRYRARLIGAEISLKFNMNGGFAVTVVLRERHGG